MSNPVAISVCALSLLTLPAAAVQRADQAPPGTVLVKGGQTKIGSKVKEVEEYGEKEETVFPILACETPQHSVRVDDFYMAVTEVTNEQYAAFVSATGWRPPESWGTKVIDEASLAYVTEMEEARQRAKEAGEIVPDRVPFDRSKWWRANWEGKAWELPKGSETLPVVYVNYEDAKAYARWAGMRLPTEFEFQRAGRGKTDNLYPWGSEPLETNSANNTMRLRAPKPVGSFPGGAVDGIYDLSGNVWEWTSSPFVPYPKYKDLEIEVGRGKSTRIIHGITTWDANQRVVVGGSFQNGILPQRLTTRRPTDRDQATEGVGFRCAASAIGGLDMAETVMSEDYPAQLRPLDVEYDTSKVLAMDLWDAEPGSAKLENYAIVKGYDFVMMVPTVGVEAVSVKGLRELGVEKGPVHMGVISMTRPTLEPELSAGTYIVAFRGAGEVVVAPPADDGTEGQEAGDEAPSTTPLPEGFDPSKDAFIFYSPSGEPVDWMEAPEIKYVRPQQPQILIGEGTRDVPGVDEEGEPIVVQEPVTQVTLKQNTWVRVSNKGFNYGLVLKFAPGTVTNDWRH